ncbi:MAG: type I glyceraldehyde-3-phosphate dehydrogenase [Candidatus Marinimicrobia bacterium]|jgi:glyceraldehyde 3-phosphate dehydrogenase|nr:type I glyceraldehyde-3-phosphate dehydrogenase [Candidatus Neomarinimicrobiota bacterium]MBT4065062.1 type I glyceraldehyde-3-phosphate dehydrogenase [Candidatus Neomarinimicrobiota bacterium]MBT4308084.1 type I glyceraldehyde-3-phosphate dehydrogenase [Candidatus Neomarinimicrobiota bacterium]MBT4453454.1 type I glyceraldehyde-3-phosphate dehydrogenase [Candidatus Neomarinimicrobiota bacterium]MBT4735895.1 type I glyceraldehyde-3-phosphate dehydrogenase [Candidatus Neomarinimicrobiota bact|tara:strand:+ start:75 stop:1091 length:1017 start_codon:yes stop_codon:yes gene_type:complete
MKKPLRIGLFGFGRIGRNIFRIGHKDPRFEFVAISDLGDVEAMHYLLMRDSIHGAMDDKITLDGNFLKYNDHSVRLMAGGTPGTVPWDAYNVDAVIDSTGAFRHRDELQPHIDAGAHRVFVTKPPIDDVDRMVIKGLNDGDIRENDKIISTTSATTQVLALMLKVLDDAFGVKQAMMTTIHAYTSDQPLADAVRSDLRRSRSAVENIIPNETWAPNYVSQLMPKFKGKLDGMAMNVPVANGSCIDLTTEMVNMPDIDSVNAAFKAASGNELKDIIGYTDDPIVSSDAIGSGDTMVFDAPATMIASNKLLKTIAWFDNGWGFASRILELADAYASLREA